MEGVESGGDHPNRLRLRFRGAFLGCVVGDALGRPFEMMSARDTRLGPGLEAMLSRSGKWSYTDDTQMMIAVAESLMRVGGVSRDDLLSALADNYDPARGYGHGMKLALEAFRNGRRPAAFASWKEGSKGNGGAVRIVPVACAYHDDPALLAALAEDSAGVTHAHHLGRAGAVAHALAIGHILSRSDETPVDGETLVTELLQARLVAGSVFTSKLQAVRRLVRDLASPGDAAQVLGNGVLAEEAVPLAIFSFLRWAPDFANVLRNTILAGGDTDTTAAMSGALCGALVGEEGIPATWIERIEAGAKGGEYVGKLGDAAFEFWSNRTKGVGASRA